MQQKTIPLLLFLPFFGCITDISSDIPQAPIKPVIMGILHPQQYITIGVYKSRGLFDTDKNVYLRNAKVELWRNDTFIALAVLDSTKQYSAPIQPKPNERWTVKVFTEYGNATATTTLPNITPITKAEYYGKVNLIREDGQDYNTNYELLLGFKDDNSMQDFYFVGTQRLRFTNYFIANTLYTNDPTIISEGRNRIQQPGNISGNGDDFYYLFSDALFNGSDKIMKFGMNLEPSLDSVPRLDVRLKLHHCNADFYKFYKSANVTNLYTKPDLLPIFFGDAENRYNNVVGGYGIFAAYSTDSIMAVFR
jgi:Domain of unknown function (DUF4249)